MPPAPRWTFLPLILLTAGSVLVYGDQKCADKSQAITLIKSLFCGYDKAVRPVKKYTDTVHVSFTLWLKHFQFEEYRNVLYLNCWTVWEWHDALLEWNPDSYNGLSSLNIESDNVWVPDITIYSMGEMTGGYSRMPSTICYLQSRGYIYCAPPTSYAASCVPDLTRWPFDTQQCLMEMGSWTHGGKELNLHLQRDVITFTTVTNREWDLISIRAENKSFTTINDTFPYLEIMIKLRRHAGGYIATVVVPALVLATLTLLMFFLDPVSAERLSLGCVNIIAHCLYMEYLGIILPSNGDSTPIIVAFFRDSLLLLGMSLLTTVILKAMLAAERAPPPWLNSTVNCVLESMPGKLLILNQSNTQTSAAAAGEDGNGLAETPTSSPDKKKPWSSAAALLDRICLIVFTVTLIGLLLAFIP